METMKTSKLAATLSASLLLCGCRAVTFDGLRDLTDDERANAGVVRQVLAFHGFDSLAEAFDRARIRVASGFRVRGWAKPFVPAYWNDLAGFATNDGNVYLKATEFSLGIPELTRIISHELAHTQGANERRARALEAEVMRKVFGVSPASPCLCGYSVAESVSQSSILPDAHRAAVTISSTVHPSSLSALPR